MDLWGIVSNVSGCRGGSVMLGAVAVSGVGGSGLSMSELWFNVSGSCVGR